MYPLFSAGLYVSLYPNARQLIEFYLDGKTVLTLGTSTTTNETTIYAGTTGRRIR